MPTTLGAVTGAGTAWRRGAGCGRTEDKRTTAAAAKAKLANMNNSFWIPDNEEADECLYENYSVCTT